MTCRGYDPKAVKVSKSIKRLAATVMDVHDRGQFIRDYVRVIQANNRGSKKSKDAE
jgi:hypothetical protein